MKRIYILSLIAICALPLRAAHSVCREALPLKAHWIITQLKLNRRNPLLCMDNLLALYGPSGTGKTTIAHAIAHEAGCTIITMPDLLCSSVQTALKSAHESTTRTIILIDSLEELCQHSLELSAEETAAGILLLRETIRDSAQNANIFIICCATHRSSIEQILDRPCGMSALEVPLPDAAKRLTLINYFARQMSAHIPDKLLTYIAKKTTDFDVRALHILLLEVAIAAELRTQKQLAKEIVHLIAQVKKEHCAPQEPSDFFERACVVTQKIIPIIAAAISAAISIMGSSKK